MEGRVGLPNGTLLDGSYRIERVIGSGGFGITYEAEDVKLRTKVAIKEYFPGEFGRRDETLSVGPTSDKQKVTFEWGRTSFLREARILARFKHPSVVQVTRVFEAYSTAYMVMVLEEGASLEAWLKRLDRLPTQEELDRIAGPILDALEMMHAQSFIHRDIAPDNIIVRTDGTPVLLDFGAARVAIAEMTKAITGIVKAGYSPQEQYATDARLQGPWTDIYAFGATLYRAVTGNAPEEATLRAIDDRMLPAMSVGDGKYRPGFLEAIDACLEVHHADRPQSVAQVRSMLLTLPAREIPPPAHLATTPRIEMRKMRAIGDVLRALGNLSPVRPSMKAWWAMFLAAVIVVVGGGVFVGLQYTGWQARERGRVEAETKRKTDAKRNADQETQRQADAAAAMKRAEDEAQARARAEAEAKRKAENKRREQEEAEQRNNKRWQAMSDEEHERRKQDERRKQEQEKLDLEEARKRKAVNERREQEEAERKADADAKREAWMPPLDRALTAAEEGRLRPGDEFQECNDCPRMVVVPAGNFTMGSPWNEASRSTDEGPQHKVTIAKLLGVGKFEVTFAEWDACVADGGCNGYRPGDQGWGRGKRPVINVNWDDAKTFATWLSRKTGKPYRLLTEAEWEYAARAGTTTTYAWGNDIGKNQANCDGCGSQWDNKQTAPVGSFKPNAFGLHDMHGNVWQWVQDCWHDKYQGAPTDGSAWVTSCTDGGPRVLRGGSWYYLPGYLRSAVRDWIAIDTRSSIIGFRLARTLDPATAAVAPEAMLPLTAEEERRIAPGDAFQECKDCPRMVVVPAGTFVMGSEERDDQGPQHKVTIAKSLGVGKFEVTFAEWDACVADGGCNGYRPGDQGWGRGKWPVINVNWDDAKAYTTWLSRKTGKTYRLLSEAEREYVARAGTTTPFWWGSSIAPKQANYDGSAEPYKGGGSKGEYRRATVPVDSFAANPWGLYQVHGNVWEWTEDCWNDSNAGNPGNGSARTSGDCSRRVLRGGSWSSLPHFLRAAYRIAYASVVRFNYFGFRVARTLESAAAAVVPEGKRQILISPPVEIRVLTAEEERRIAPGQEFQECNDCPRMVVVPAGSFTMGSNDYYDEKPWHRVTIAKPLAVGKFTLTFAEWDACVAAGGCKHRPEDQGWGRANRPAINVSWDDATKEYLPWLSRKTGKTYRLLTEAEWEYAARAGATMTYSWGNDVGKNQANCNGCGSQWDNKQTAPVGSFKPNAFGLHDMHGNVWQWVQDCYKNNYNEVPTDGSASPEVGACPRLLRGGSWINDPRYLRAAYRARGIQPFDRDNGIGFRLARTLNP